MMKNTSKRTTTTTPILDLKPSAGPDGFALAPPAYGIDFLDRTGNEAGAETVLQRKAAPPATGDDSRKLIPNHTGLPDGLKSGIESLSGLSLDDVRVHFNSSRPAQLQALAYTQGANIHVAPGQERHLPHEAWHVVQQKQGRVKPTLRMGQAQISDDSSLEKEAERMGRATIMGQLSSPNMFAPKQSTRNANTPSLQLHPVIQRVGDIKFGIQEATRVGLTTTAAYQALQLVVDAYHQEVRDEKANATAWFNSGNTADATRQDQYSDRLFRAQMDVAELKRRISARAELRLNALDDNIIEDSTSGEEVARIQTGNAAYVLTKQVMTPTAELGQVQNVYKKRWLGGPTNKEYIEVQGRKLRRFANRGITPPEKRQIRGGGDVLPVYHTLADRQQNQTGMHYPENASPYVRPPTKQTGPPHRRRTVRTGDLDFLHAVSGVNRTVTQIPQVALPFVQERKGVGKSFSATATSSQITSNHGAGFGTFGSITLDLAKVDPNDILEHYANKGTVPLLSGIPATDIVDPVAMTREELRAGRTALRNREIHLNKYPASAVVGGIQDSPGVTAYKAAYRPAYDDAYDRAYESGYTRGYGSSRGSGANYKRVAERTYQYTYASNGTGANAGRIDGRDHGDEDGYRDGQEDGTADR